MVYYPAGRTKSEMTEIRCNGLLFDLDGVLIDSTPCGYTSLAPTGPGTRLRSRGGCCARPRPASLATVRECLPNGDHAAENRVIERREMQDADGIITLPGARELLLQLPAKRWTIATSCARPLAEVRLRAAGLPVPERIVTSTDVTLAQAASRTISEGRCKVGLFRL